MGQWPALTRTSTKAVVVIWELSVLIGGASEYENSSGECCTELDGFGVVLGISRVVTDADTRFRELSCDRLRNGLLVRVEGIRRVDASILAREVESTEHR